MVVIIATVALTLITIIIAVTAVLLLFDIARWAGWAPEMGVPWDGGWPSGDMAWPSSGHPRHMVGGWGLYVNSLRIPLVTSAVSPLLSQRQGKCEVWLHFKWLRLNWLVLEQPCDLITGFFYLITKWPEQQKRHWWRECNSRPDSKWPLISRL